MRLPHVVALLLLASTPLAGQSRQWTQLDGPSSGFITSMAVDRDSIIYAGTWRGGVYVRSVTGTSWSPFNTGLTNAYVQTLIVDPAHTVYAGTTAGVFRHPPGNGTWQPAGLNTHVIEALAGTGAGILAAATSDAGIFVSGDGGTNWLSINSGIPNLMIMSVMFDRNGNLFAGSGGSGVFKSTNAGVSWQRSPNAIALQFIRALGQDSSGTLWAGTSSGIFRSTNGGTVWTTANGGMADRDIRALHVTPKGILVAGAMSGIFIWNPATSAWSPTGSSVRSVHVIRSTNDSSLIAGFDGPGIFISTSTQAAWFAASTGIRNTFVRSVVVTPEERIFASFSEAGVAVSSDSGEQWTAYGSGLGGSIIDILHRSADGTLLAGSTTGSLFRRRGADSTWTPAGKIAGRGIRSIFETGDSLLLGTTDGIFLSCDSGGTWADCGRNISGLRVDALAGASNGSMLAGTNNGIFTMSSGGSSWVRRDPFAALEVHALHKMSGRFFAATSEGVGRSTDQGVSWTFSRTGFTDRNLLCLSSIDSTLFAGSWSEGIFRSTDHGATWWPAGKGLGRRSIWSLTSAPVSRLYAGTYGDGLFRSSRIAGLLLDIDTEEGMELPLTASLAQNYPNPFNPATTIEYHLPVASRVAFRIFDMLGRQVALIAEGDRAAGTHRVRWDASALPSGMYVYTLLANDRRFVHKMLLMR